MQRPIHKVRYIHQADEYDAIHEEQNENWFNAPLSVKW